MKLVMLKYQTPKGIILEKMFLKILKGYKPVFIDEGLLDKSNKIIEENEVNL